MYMSMDLDSQILAAIISGFLAIGGTTIAAVLQFRKQLDEDLRMRRIIVYQQLFSRLKLLRIHSYPSSSPTYAEIENLLVDLTDGYYEHYGIFISAKSRNLYTAILDTIEKGLEENVHQSNDKFPNEIHKELILIGSKLRTSLLRDIGTRQEYNVKCNRDFIVYKKANLDISNRIIHVTGEVKNDSYVNLSFPRIKISYYDKDNKFIGDDDAFVASDVLGPDKRSHFDIHTKLEDLQSENVNLDNCEMDFEWIDES